MVVIDGFAWTGFLIWRKFEMWKAFLANKVFTRVEGAVLWTTEYIMGVNSE